MTVRSCPMHAVGSVACGHCRALPEVAAQVRLAGWSDDAKKAIVENPDYFVWWYTVKSVGLGVVAALAAYYIGREQGRRSRR